MVVMLYKTNILALVGSNNNSSLKQTKVIIWDDNQKNSLCELTFSGDVLNVKLRKDKIIVVSLNKIYLFDLNTFQNLDIIETGENPRGAIGINYTPENTLIAYPDKKIGKIKVKNYELKEEVFIDAHEKLIGNIAMTNNGDLLASATKKGHIIRIFDTLNGEFLQEVRRGSDKVEINYICFAPDYKFIASSSNKNTIHIWSLYTTMKKLKNKAIIKENLEVTEKIQNGDKMNLNKDFIINRYKFLNVIPNFLGSEFFNSEWSFAKIKLSEPSTVMTFCPDNTVIILSSHGKYYKAKIDLEKGGNCQIVQEEKFL